MRLDTLNYEFAKVLGGRATDEGSLSIQRICLRIGQEFTDDCILRGGEGLPCLMDSNSFSHWLDQVPLISDHLTIPPTRNRLSEKNASAGDCGTYLMTVRRSHMVYSFKQGNSIDEQFRSITDYQIGEALAILASSDQSKAEIVHEVRRRCTKLRGLIRLVRPSFAQYKTENDIFKQIAHLFDDLRDAEVIQATYDSLMSSCEERIDLQDFCKIRRELKRRDDVSSTNADWESRKEQAKGLLIKVRERAQEWSLSDEGWEAVQAGLADTYSRARKAMCKARKKPIGPLHHEWRKQTKYHWCHTRLLKRSFPEMMLLRATLLQVLANNLGDHHDIYVFIETIDGEPEAFGNEGVLAVIRAIAERKSASFEDTAARSGVRLFADHEDALLSRWAAWWRVWQTEGARAHAP